MNQWHKMTWQELGEVTAAGTDAAILPVGALEQHGPHLGCGTDAQIAEMLGLKMAEMNDIVLLPTLPYGCSGGHSQRWPGTIALQPKTMIDVVKEIGDWVYASGFRRLFIVNSHVTNFAPLRCALEMLRAQYDDLMVAVISTGTMSERVKEAHFSDADDWHANDAETSLMLAMAPEMVREELVAQSDDPDRTEGCVFSHLVNRTSKNGVTGTPSTAAKEKGQKLFGWMIEDLSNLIRKGLREKPPLPNSYFKK